MESSLKLMDVYLVLFFVFCGYLIPVELFPPALRSVVRRGCRSATRSASRSS